MTTGLNKNFAWIDYMVFVSLLVGSSLIGVYFWYKDRKIQNNKNYLVGDRNLAVVPVALSLAASFMSTNTILGAPAEVYMLGSQFWMNMVAFFAAIMLATYVFMPVYYDLELVSINKYLLYRFGSNAVRLSGSIGFILATLAYMGVVLYGPSLALNAVTPLSMPVSIWVVGAICTFYTTMGGLKAVIWTDVIQFIFMILGLLMIAVCGYLDFGFSKPFQILKDGGRLIIFDGQWNIHRSDVFWSVFLGTLSGWTGVYCVKQTQIQRYCCLNSKSKARKALWIHIPMVIGIAYLAMYCGVILYAEYRNCDPVRLGEISRHDQMIPYYAMEKMGHIPGLPGLFVVCVFSGALSTLSSGYNALATVTWDDFLKRYYRTSSEKTTGRVTKLISAVYGLLSIGIAFFIGRLGTVFQASQVLAGSISGPLLGLFLLGFFFPFVDYIAGLSSIFLGFIVCLWISIGSLINKRPTIELPVTTDQCSVDSLDRYFQRTGQYPPGLTPANFTLPWSYEPEGLNYIYHISYWLVPTTGFVITFVLGILIAMCRKWFGISEPLPNRKLFSPFVQRLYYDSECEDETSANLKIHQGIEMNSKDNAVKNLKSRNMASADG